MVQVLEMIRPIMKNPLFLAKKSADATKEDLPVAFDLMQTLEAHADECVGMALGTQNATRR